MKNNQVKAIAMVGLMTASLAAGSMFAYLTGVDTQQKVFTLGNVTGTLELSDDITNHSTGLYPTEVIEATPVITNTGANPAIVYLELTIPAETIQVSDSSGVAEAEALTELFSTMGTEASSSINEDWELVGSKAAIKEGAETVGYKYVYGYKKVLEASDAATATFDDLQFANVIYPDSTMDDFTVSFRADLIQSEGMIESLDTNNKIKTADLSAVYNKFAAQNPD